MYLNTNIHIFLCVEIYKNFITKFHTKYNNFVFQLENFIIINIPL